MLNSGLPDESGKRDSVYDGEYHEVDRSEKEVEMSEHVDLAALAAFLSNNNNCNNRCGGDRSAADVAAIIAAANGGWGGNWGWGGHRRGGDDCCGADPFETMTLKALGDVLAAVPTAALQTQNSILESQNNITQQITQGNVAVVAAVGGVKDAVNSSLTALLLSGNQNTQQIIAAINLLSSKSDQNVIADLERQLAQERCIQGRHSSGDIEMIVKNVVSNSQSQNQEQRQFSDVKDLLVGLVSRLNIIENQVNRTSQDIINVGGVLAGASNTANPVNVK